MRFSGSGNVKNISEVEMELFIYPTEDEKKVLESVKTLTEIKPTKESIESYYGPKIKKITYKIKKSRDIKSFINKLKSLLSETDRNEILESLGDRIDSEGKLYIRFSKQDLLKGKLKKQYSGDIILVKIHLISYQKADEHKKIAKEILA
ncbi:hypothetical protein DRN74_03685 [Candidatus Micrarchaeota archaeon]|nr:MAG: hypothetical protein DRN74_03685 [Candidatus Micrarchaeota archaeon]